MSLIRNLPENERTLLDSTLSDISMAYGERISADEVWNLWTSTVAECLAAYQGHLDTYISGLRARGIVRDALEILGDTVPTFFAIVDQVDNEFKGKTEEVDKQLTGPGDPGLYWFYSRIPKNRSHEFEKEFENIGGHEPRA